MPESYLDGWSKEKVCNYFHKNFGRDLVLNLNFLLFCNIKRKPGFKMRILL